MAELNPDLILASCAENNGPMLLAVGWALLALALMMILLRVIFRHRYGNGLHADDYTMMASMACGITAVILLTLFVNAGFGRHIYCLPPSSLPSVFKYSVLAQIFNIAGIGLVKISVCLHVLRIVDRARQHISLFLRLLILITLLSHLAQILLFFVQCRPMPAIWSPASYPNAHCFSSHITYLAGYIGFGLDAFTDLVTAIIPTLVIHSLQMNARTKLALCTLMGLGTLTAVCAVAKALTLQGIFAADYTWALWRPGLCTIIEHLAGMIIASAPALNPLFKRALRTPSSSSSSSSFSDVRRRRQRRSTLPRSLDGDRNARQHKRVSRWADAWTPPNVHVAHYSPYASERQYASGRARGTAGARDWTDEKDVNLSRATHDSEITAVSSERTAGIDVSGGSGDGGNNECDRDRDGDRTGEITRTISVRQVSEHTAEGEDGAESHQQQQQQQQHEQEEWGGDRLWIGNGYWGLPPAPTRREGEAVVPSPSVVGNLPHPAVGRWVREGGEKPGPRAAAGFGD